MRPFSTRILSLLLALVMVFSIMPSALAVDETTEEHIHTEECSHEETVIETEEAEIPVTEETPEELAAEVPVTSLPVVQDTPDSVIEDPIVTTPVPINTFGYILGSTVYWELSNGQLLISGYGDCPTFTSAADQPWAHLRDQISAVWFNTMDDLSISNLAYWFDGCINLVSAEIPYTTSTIGTRAFADCPNLTDILFYYYDSDSFAIVPGAFYVSQPTDTNIHLIREQQYTVFKLMGFDWKMENRQAEFYDVYTAVKFRCSLSGCTCTDCYTYTNVYPGDSSKHRIYIECSGCSAQFWYYDEAHTFSGGYCTSCGEKEPYVAPSCSHTSISTYWSGCYWEDYCTSCGDTMDSGYSHSYRAGAWTYYTDSQHRRTYSCSYCYDSYSSYGYHSGSTKYTQRDDSQHTQGSYCSSCSSYYGTIKTVNHTLSYTSWTTTDTQHSRTKSCSLCGYSGTESGEHTDTNGDGACDACGYVTARFSVTVPTSMTMTVSKYGEVYTAESASILNNSTGTVTVSGVSVTTANGWTLVPYTTNMANEKMDAKLIGFSINGAQTASIGTSEDLSISGWNIAKGDSLSLNYDAVVSGSRAPINEQVLTVVFVLNWAA